MSKGILSIVPVKYDQAFWQQEWTACTQSREITEKKLEHRDALILIGNRKGSIRWGTGFQLLKWTDSGNILKAGISDFEENLMSFFLGKLNIRFFEVLRIYDKCDSGRAKVKPYEITTTHQP
jgi:hypothetical protein